MARAVRSGSRADTVVLVACAAMSLLATILPGSIREVVAGALRRTVVAPLIGLQAQAERARGAFVNRDRTMAQIDTLTLRNLALTEMVSENDRLRRLLGLASELRWGFVPAEALQGRGYADEHTVVLTAGDRAGVKKGAAVVAPDGLVGMVTSVDPATSLAILWTHPDFAASAMAGPGGIFGIVKPHLGEAPERYLLELQGVAFRETLRAESIVRTSGLGGIFPRGIPIGQVLGELTAREGWSRTYLVRPAVKPQDVTSVMILLPERGSGDMSAIWSSPNSADSAMRAVVRAADSVAAIEVRDSLRSEAARRDTSAAARDTVPRRP